MAKPEFAFDEWKRLASTDPEAFEKKRERLIRKTISNAPSNYRSRLLRLQWRVDMERKRHANPMSSCVRISKMMLDSVYGEHGLVSALNGTSQRQSDLKPSAANVLNMTERKKAREA